MKITKISKENGMNRCAGRFSYCRSLNRAQFELSGEPSYPCTGYNERLCRVCLHAFVSIGGVSHEGIKPCPVKYEDLTQEDIQDMSQGEYLYNGGPTGLPPNVTYQTFCIIFDPDCVILGETLLKEKTGVINNY